MSAYVTPLAECRGWCGAWTHAVTGFCVTCEAPPVVVPRPRAALDGPSDYRLTTIAALRFLRSQETL